MKILDGIMDGVNWEKSGEVRDLNNDYNLKVLNLNKPTEAKFVKLQAINTYGYPNDVFFTGRMLNFFEDTTKYNNVPTIDAENKTIKVNEDFDPLSGVTASDKEDGDITSKIKVITNEVNTKVLEHIKLCMKLQIMGELK
ncbi:DUF5011 domain-containing protein [Clostridium perfringens]|nr:DUF5011 domain-containing protein [Clostridium perfringens]